MAITWNLENGTNRYWANLGSGSGVYWGGGRPDLGDYDNKWFWELKPDGAVDSAQRRIKFYDRWNVYTPAPSAPDFFAANMMFARGVYGMIAYRFAGQGEIYYEYKLNEGFKASTPFQVPKWVIPLVGSARSLAPVLEGLPAL